MPATADRVRRRVVFAALAALCGGRGAYAANQPGAANGVFLVAKPELRHPNFRETVLLITQPAAGAGPIGVVLNRPLGARLSQILPGAADWPEAFDAIYAGGPVQRQRLLFLMRSEQRPLPSLQVLEDVHFSADRALLERIVRGEVEVSAFRAYAGYTGWAPRQLQAEIQGGGWYLAKADPDIIFSDDTAAMWPELIKRLTTRVTQVHFAPNV